MLVFIFFVPQCVVRSTRRFRKSVANSRTYRRSAYIIYMRTQSGGRRLSPATCARGPWVGSPRGGSEHGPRKHTTWRLPIYITHGIYANISNRNASNVVVYKRWAPPSTRRPCALTIIIVIIRPTDCAHGVLSRDWRMDAENHLLGGGRVCRTVFPNRFAVATRFMTTPLVSARLITIFRAFIEVDNVVFFKFF